MDPYGVLSNSSTASITVIHINHPPVANNQSVTTHNGVSITLTATDSDGDGLAYSIKVGKLQGDNYPVSFTSSGTPRKDDKDAERLKKLEDRLPREKVLSDYVLYVPKSKLEDTLKKRAEMLEKKDDAKK